MMTTNLGCRCGNKTQVFSVATDDQQMKAIARAGWTISYFPDYYPYPNGAICPDCLKQHIKT